MVLLRRAWQCTAIFKEKILSHGRWVLALSLLALALYIPLLQNFFWQDDWYFLHLARIDSPWQVLQFFSPVVNEVSTPMYRPLTSQFFFWIMYSVFGLRSFFWYGVSLFLTGSLFVAVWKYLEALGLSWRARMVSQIVFAFSVTHFYRISYLSAVQEIVMALFVVLALWASLRKVFSWKAWALFFFLALLSKETAVVFAPLLTLQMLYRREWRWKEWLASVFMTLAYLCLRFGVYGVDRVGGEHYSWVFSPFAIIHTGIWYLVWSLGLPELTIHYVGSGFRLLPHFWTDFPQYSVPIIVLFLLTVGAFSLLGLWQFAKRWREKTWWESLLFSGGFLVVALLPVLFLPEHKYPLGQTLGLLGLGMFLGNLLEKLTPRLIFAALSIYVVFNVVSVAFAYERHYSMTRSRISERVYNAIQEKKDWPEPFGIYFVNEERITNAHWGSSKQIDQAINSEHFAPVVFGRSVPLRFEDTTQRADLSKDVTWIEWDTRNFID